MQLGVRLGSGTPPICGIYPAGCSGAVKSVSIGDVTSVLTNTGSSYPSPFGNYYRNTKHQFIFRASELIAAGLRGGLINGISFDVKSLGAITVSNQYTIKMGCTSLPEFSNTSLEFETGLVQVFNPKPFNASLGVNSIDFDF